jgi:hypothetical protein
VVKRSSAAEVAGIALSDATFCGVDMKISLM